MSTEVVPLTPRQKQLLFFVADWIREHHYPPSIYEIAAGLGHSSKASSQDMMRTVEAKGYLSRQPGQFRTVHPTPKGWELHEKEMRT